MCIIVLWKQTFIVSKARKFSREGLECTDKRAGLMNEILAAMETVKYVLSYLIQFFLFGMMLTLQVSGIQYIALDICQMLRMGGELSNKSSKHAKWWTLVVPQIAAARSGMTKKFPCKSILLSVPCICFRVYCVCILVMHTTCLLTSFHCSVWD